MTPILEPSRPGRRRSGAYDWLLEAARRMNMLEMAVLHPRILAMVAVLLLALPVGALGRVQYFCHGMARVMDECCCPRASTVQSVRPIECNAKIRSRDCCERLERATSQAAPALRENAGSPGSPPAVLGSRPLIVVVAQREAPDSISTRLETSVPPPRGPPLFLANCSLLI